MSSLTELSTPATRLAHSVDLPVLGIPVQFESDDPTILTIVEEAFGTWRAVGRRPELIAPTGVRACFLRRDGDEGNTDHAPLSYSMPEFARVTVQSPGSVGVADADRRAVVAHVSGALVADREHFRYGVVEALTLALLTRFDRQPLHAAALVRDGAALLLAGPSGVGKSTLAYAAALDGIQVIAEDVVYVQRDPRLRVWGMPGHIHLPPDARTYFRELADRRETVLANGNRKIAVDVASLERDDPAPLPVSERVGICILTRADGRAELEALSPRQAVAELTDRHEPGFDVFADTIGACVEEIASAGGWKLNAVLPPRDLVSLLHRLFDELGESADGKHYHVG